MIRSVIVDDEKYSREVLKDQLLSYCTDIDVIDMADCIKSAKICIEQYRPDLVFLDIDMPNGSGFDLLKNFDRLFFKVVFVTGHNEFAIEAFRYSASHYLLKPVGPRELREAVEKVRNEIDRDIEFTNTELLLQWAQSTQFTFNTIVIPHLEGFKVVNISEIIYCRADSYCTELILTGGRHILSTRNLLHFEETLQNRSFFRVHNSYLINLHHVREFVNDGSVILNDNQTAPIGNTYRRRFLDFFKRMK